MVTTPDLSIVIIARNEARNIGRAIESVLCAVQDRPGSEILLVDSASTDGTVEIAKHYPINIVCLGSDWFHSVAAGRHIGMLYSHAELVLHMDGDMEMDPDWVNRAVNYITAHPQVAAVGGYWRNIYVKNGEVTGEEDQYRFPGDEALEEPYVGGASLYRRSAIQQVGGFQPYIRGEEDVLLCIALRHAGYRVMRLPYCMSRHYCIPPKTLSGYLRRVRLDLWLGYGQVPRYTLGTPLFWTYLCERGSYLGVYIAALITLAALGLSILLKNILYIVIWLLVIAGVVLYFSIKKHSLNGALSSVVLQTLIAISSLRGFLRKPRSPQEYPTNAEIVQMHSYQSRGNRDLSGTAFSQPSDKE